MANTNDRREVIGDSGRSRVYNLESSDDIREIGRNLLALAPLCNALGCSGEYQTILDRFYQRFGMFDISAEELKREIGS